MGKRMRTLTIKTKVVILSAALLFLVVSSIAVAGYGMHVIHVREDEAAFTCRIQGRLQWLMICFEKTLMGPHDYLIHGNKDERLTFEHDIARFREALDETIDFIASEKVKRRQYLAQVLAQLETRLMDLEGRVPEYETRAKEILGLEDPTVHPIARVYMEAMDALVAIMQNELDKQATSLEELSARKTQEARVARAQVQSRLIIFCVIIFLFALILTCHVVQRITTPLNDLVATTRNLMSRIVGGTITTGMNNETGELGSYFNAMADKLLETQRKMSAIFHGSELPILVIDKDFGVLDCNDTMKRLLGGPGPNSEGDKCYEHVSCELCRTDKCPASRVLAGEECVETEVTIKTRGGQEMPTKLVATPLRRQGHVDGVIESFHDIRERKETEGALQKSRDESEKILRELKTAQRQMLQSEKMASIGQLAAGVAHEINNPTGFVSSNLHTLSGYHKDINELIDQYGRLVSGLREAMTTEQGRAGILEDLHRIAALKKEIDIDFVLDDTPNLIKESIEGIERVKKIVTDLKNFAHPAEDKPKLADINKGLESTLNIVWNELKYKAKVIKEYGELPPVKCYPHQLNQVFMNLLVNAAQAIEKQGEIRIETRAVDGHVEISITDTGSGISEANLSKIFDPFFTIKEVGEGTGLGLYLAHNIIDKHNGTIDVESEVGKGTTFTIRLQTDPGIEVDQDEGE
jgi:PAS domain S-box-containing protein